MLEDDTERIEKELIIAESEAESESGEAAPE